MRTRALERFPPRRVQTHGALSFDDQSILSERLRSLLCSTTREIYNPRRGRREVESTLSRHLIEGDGCEHPPTSPGAV
ncbi:hypothetical protein EVAR_17403_1 [Eumeta japonica]|uniref:Uncharacterized protein n=1 Tax=Eumeta variegata TaxID=151549 RepID=A0A4C1VB34_EUMVA|nr:hypothetical protein EVAR_17403_1 [Eumeta japonica]